MFLCRRFFALPLSFLIISTLRSQTPDTTRSPQATFQSKVQVVLVDVVVTDHNDEPIAGLQKEDFEIFEEGTPQAIASFEEHKGVPLNQAEMPPLPPHYYTNYPLAKPADSVNVLVLDALNTPKIPLRNVAPSAVATRSMGPRPVLAAW